MSRPNVFKVGSRVRCVVGCLSHRGEWIESGSLHDVYVSNRRDLWLEDVMGVVDPANFVEHEPAPAGPSGEDQTKP
jgi:hypothetical protein